MIRHVAQSGVLDQRDADHRLQHKSDIYENFSIDLKDRAFDEEKESDHTISFLSVNIYAVIKLDL
jgi:hypothetical protein